MLRRFCFRAWVGGCRGAGRLSWCRSSAAAWQLSFGTPQRIMSAGLLAKADRLRLRTARAPCQALCQRPAASSQGTRPGARSCWRLPLFQPPVVAPQPPTRPVERSLKRQHTIVSRRGAVRWSLARASSPPLGSPTTIEDRASIEHERGVWGGMLSRVLVGSQVAAWGLWGGETPLAGAFSRP